LIGVGTRSAEGLAADRKAEHWSTAVSHPVNGLGAPAFTVGDGIVARRADGLVIELSATLTLQQDEAIVRRLLATP
jgi:hypothetical protein